MISNVTALCLCLRARSRFRLSFRGFRTPHRSGGQTWRELDSLGLFVDLIYAAPTWEVRSILFFGSTLARVGSESRCMLLAGGLPRVGLEKRCSTPQGKTRLHKRRDSLRRCIWYLDSSITLENGFYTRFDFIRSSDLLCACLCHAAEWPLLFC